uniref:F-box/LRR-repeat protein 7 n=1 Tax=Talaromyces marneffei PM1 TaxID=1077442 RepID=A0A093UQV5_TALMA
MRRQRRSSSGASSKAAAPIPEAVSLIHSFDSALNPNRPARPSPLASSQIQGMPLDLIERIRNFPLFQSTPDSFLAEVGLHLRPQLHAANDYIVTEGDEAKAMYWLVRGAVAVTSRDGESVHAELKPGAFFGEIGVLMDRPRTATIIARSRCLLVVLTKEDFRKILPRFPEVERAIREEALERLSILEKKNKERYDAAEKTAGMNRRGSKRLRESNSGGLSLGEENDLRILNANKKRKSPSPGIADISSSALANGSVNVRSLLKEMPLFSSLTPDLLHYLGLKLQPRSYPPFTDIIRQDSLGREIYFIVRGEVEVLNENRDSEFRKDSEDQASHGVEVKARLRQGQYFGEIVSLSLTPRRTATVRSVTSVECLMLSGDVLAEFWQKCPDELRQQIELTAKKRLESTTDTDVLMADATDPTPPINQLTIDDKLKVTSRRRKSMPLVTLTESELDNTHQANGDQEAPVLSPSDPDPFLTSDLTMSSSNRVEALWYQQGNRGFLPDNVLVRIFEYLELHHLLRLRAVCAHWSKILTESPTLCRDLDLSVYNRKVTDDALSTIICPFVKDRPFYIDINNCFHITDEGFSTLVKTCGHNIRAWKMKSVWDVTATAILEMAGKATDCAGAVYGCPQLKKLTLSYCKHVTDRSMHHIASHAAPRIEQVDLTRCTTITDQGFQYWGNAQFTKLRKLCLADCTYLTDHAIVCLTNAAKNLQELDLSFCCALSDTATEVLALQCPQLLKLNMSFCGSAVSDPSLRSLSLHLLLLQELSVRGCVRVTGIGVEAVADGCQNLSYLNVSQCKNLQPWLERGGPLRYQNKIQFETVAKKAVFR